MGKARAKDQLRNELDEMSYLVTQKAATEPPFSGKYLKTDKKGDYICICCENKLFSSDTKFNSGTGWLSFNDALPESVETRPDNSHGVERTEVLCGKCHAHLGHVFDENNGKRFCINSAALDLIKKNDEKTDKS